MKAQLTKAQTLFFVTLILESAHDRCTTVEFENEEQETQYFCGVMDTAGLALASLYAQITGDGMGIQDAIDLARFTPKDNPKECAKIFIENCFNNCEFAE